MGGRLPVPLSGGPQPPGKVRQKNEMKEGSAIAEFSLTLFAVGGIRDIDCTRKSGT